VFAGVRPCLDIHATLEGRLGLSQFYTRLVEGEDSTAVACGMHVTLRAPRPATVASTSWQRPYGP
jgi:hypothetical protein